MKILWNEERVNILKEFYSNDSWEDLYLRLGTNNRMAIQSKASKLRIKRNIKDENVSLPSRSGEFTEIEDDYIIKNYNNMKAKDIAVNLNRGLNQIYKRVQILNIKKEQWSEQDIKILKQIYPDFSNEYLVNNYFKNKTSSSVGMMAKKLMLKKNSEKNNKIFNKDDLLFDLKQLSEKLGRTPYMADLIGRDMPSEITYRRYFGTYSKACILCGLVPNSKCFGASVGCVSSNGDKCDSNAEYVITEYLIANNIPYTKEVRYSDYSNHKDCNTKTCDWVIDGVFVEYFGLPEKEYYFKKMEVKRCILKDSNIELIELFRNDLNKLDLKLKRFSQ